MENVFLVVRELFCVLIMMVVVFLHLCQNSPNYTQYVNFTVCRFKNRFQNVTGRSVERLQNSQEILKS